MTEPIDSPAHYRATLHRAAALREHRAALQAVQARASAGLAVGTVEREDIRDLAALDDVLADLGYTLRGLEAALTDWETRETYCTLDDPAADRAWHRRRTL